MRCAYIEDGVVTNIAMWSEAPDGWIETDVAGVNWTYDESTEVFSAPSVVAYKKSDMSVKYFPTEESVTDDYTLLVPATEWDEWDEDTGAWVTDTTTQYNDQLAALVEKNDALLNAKAIEYARAKAADGSDESENVLLLQAQFAALVAQAEEDENNLLLGLSS